MRKGLIIAMIFTTCKLLRTAGFLFLVAAVTHGDVIRLKSGGIVTGIITQVKKGTVCINVGWGTTFIDSADVLSIQRSSAAENDSLRLDRDACNADPRHRELQKLIDKLRKLRALRITAINRQRSLERLDAEIDSLERALCENADGYQALNPDLGTLSKKRIAEQYRLVGQAHQFNSSIIGLQQAIEDRKADQQKGNPALADYLDSVALTEQEFRAFKKSCTKTTLKNNRAVMSGIEDDFKRYKSEFKTAVTDATFIQGDHIIVPVSINGRTPVSLLFDTGASTVTISQALADRLGINWRSGVKVSASMADGRTSEGYSVLLRSVAVGDFRADNVRAVVLKDPPFKGIDGLLGMSYLQRFHLRIDPANKKFVLKRIVAK